MRIKKRTNEGKAEQAYLEADALGQQAQTNVLGPDKVMYLRIADKVIEALKEHPEILNKIVWPQTAVFGSGGFDLGAAAAIFSGKQLPSK